LPSQGAQDNATVGQELLLAQRHSALVFVRRGRPPAITTAPPPPRSVPNAQREVTPHPIAAEPRGMKKFARFYMNYSRPDWGRGSIDVELEKAVPEAKGRIDGLLGRTVFEIKSDLARELGDAEHRLPDYIEDREKATGQQYVGIATDGLDWRVYELRSGKLWLLSFRTDPKNPRALLIGLDGAVALEAEIEPSAEKIRIELGRE
jgi:hypothetical protein